jgi:hypothetical protein
MCDCYEHQCNSPGCEESIPMHLGDYETDREEIEVFCSKHIPEDKLNGDLWKVQDSDDLRYPNDTLIFIRPLTKNAKKNAHHNHPNTYNMELVK